MKDRQIDRSAIYRSRRGTALFVAGALALGLGVPGFHAAFAGGSPTERTGSAPRITSTLAQPEAPLEGTLPVRAIPAPPSPATQPTADPTALADGVYPTYVRAVDVEGATVTVDVLQTFVGAAAHQAAVEDGRPWREVRYDPVYIRNENPLLRTLPVAADVHIKLIGLCEAPDRWIGLTQLRAATTPFTDTFYYDITVSDGAIDGIRQLVAVAGC
jgi:hypothetical protein